MLAGDINKGRIYHFDPNADRTGLTLDGSLKYKIADANKDLKQKIFA